MCDEIYKSLDISMYKFNCINGKKAFLLIKTQYIYTNTLIFFVTISLSNFNISSISRIIQQEWIG
jgi:hypothetical protein